MKVSIYAKSFSPEYVDELIWEGEMDSIPRKGEYVSVFDGWGAVIVDEPCYSLKVNGTATVELWFKDINGEYSEHARKLKLEQS